MPQWRCPLCRTYPAGFGYVVVEVDCVVCFQKSNNFWAAQPCGHIFCPTCMPRCGSVGQVVLRSDLPRGVDVRLQSLFDEMSGATTPPAMVNPWAALLNGPVGRAVNVAVSSDEEEGDAESDDATLAWPGVPPPLPVAQPLRPQPKASPGPVRPSRTVRMRARNLEDTEPHLAFTYMNVEVEWLFAGNYWEVVLFNRDTLLPIPWFSELPPVPNGWQPVWRNVNTRANRRWALAPVSPMVPQVVISRIGVVERL